MRRNTKWLLALGGIIVVLVAIVGFSRASSSQASQGKLTTVKIGVAPGPYGDMATKVIGPLLEKKGYKVVTKEFNDYVQPNKALNSGEIDALEVIGHWRDAHAGDGDLLEEDHGTIRFEVR